MKGLVVVALVCGACGDNSNGPRDASGSDAQASDAQASDAQASDAPGIDAPDSQISLGTLTYTDPEGGKLRLIRSQTAPSTDTAIVLELVVGSQPLTGYSAGFDLPLDDTRVSLMGFTPGSALNAGTAPVAARGALPQFGALAHHLVTAQSQKASGAGAVSTDTELPAGTSLYTFELGIIGTSGVVFDGTAPGFVLTSGGLRDRLGNTVVDTADVAIGKLEIIR